MQGIVNSPKAATLKIICLIDSLGSGGAQRQLVTIALNLKKRGHEIRFLVYHKEDHFLPLLEKASIPCEIINARSLLRRAYEIRLALRNDWQDVVLAFLEASCLYSELARIPRQKWGLVVGERCGDPRILTKMGTRLRQFHRLADCVVTNSHTNRLMLQSQCSFLAKKLVTIYNIVDTEQFYPAEAPSDSSADKPKIFRIVVAASYQSKKNMRGMAEALKILSGEGKSCVVDWYGGQAANPAYNDVKAFIAENNLKNVLRLHPATTNIASEFRTASAVALLSFYEGLPNAVCEAMACGKPILLSNVCDASNLVQDGVNGFLCDPCNPADIAARISCLMDLTFEERSRMGLSSRHIAEHLFQGGPVIDRYEQILQRASRGEPFDDVDSWPATVPESAARALSPLIPS